MSRPLFTVVIPTLGRPSLPRTLASIPDDVETIVVGDSHGGLTAEQKYILHHFSQVYYARYLELDAGRHDRGDSQIAYGFAQARGLWLLNCGDDDVYEPGAFNVMSRAIAEQAGPEHPLMFKVELLSNPVRGNQDGTILWSHRGRIEQFKVTGQSFVCPNDPERLGVWDTDWRFMQTTVAKYGGAVDWRDELTMRCY
jgi:hypothetical protein